MVRDDLQACLQAYQSAELSLAGAPEGPEKERQQALDAARRLRDEVQPRYEAATSSARYSSQAIGPCGPRSRRLQPGRRRRRLVLLGLQDEAIATERKWPVHVLAARGAGSAGRNAGR